MAEERISIFFIPDNPCNGCEVEHECPFDCPTKKEYDRCMTRKEAIEKMAKAIHYYEWAHDKHFPKWDELNGDIQNDYKNMANAALNALLEK